MQTTTSGVNKPTQACTHCHRTWAEPPCLADEVVADVAHQGHQPRRTAVVLRVLPDEQQRVQDGLEQAGQRWKVVHAVQTVQRLAQRLQVPAALSRHLLRGIHLAAQPHKRGQVRAGARLKRRHGALHAWLPQLLPDACQLCGPVGPVVQLRQRARRGAVCRAGCRLGLLAQHRLDLPRPCHQRCLQQAQHVGGHWPSS